MKNYYFLFLVFLLISLGMNAQEWKSIKKYKKETGLEVLSDGCWLKKDRKRNTLVWNQANAYNLQEKNGYKKYATISQIRDFYNWFDNFIQSKGHAIEWVGYATIACRQFSKLDNPFLRVFVVNNKEVVQFVKEGTYKVLAFSFPLLKSVYNSDYLIVDKEALEWDSKYGEIEQCEILEPLYFNLSEKALRKINRMAEGKGIYYFGVPKEIRFDGDISDCDTRVKHILSKIQPYYRENKK